MGDAVKATENPQKKSFFKGLKSEFKKIVWPDRKKLTKETTAVFIISVILGIIISVIDLVIKFGFDKLLQFYLVRFHRPLNK